MAFKIEFIEINHRELLTTKGEIKPFCSFEKAKEEALLFSQLVIVDYEKISIIEYDDCTGKDIGEESIITMSPQYISRKERLNGLEITCIIEP